MKHSPEYLAYLQSPAWKALRVKVFARLTNGRCEWCGDRKARQVHHKTYARLFREELDDLLAVCRDCHLAIHGKGPRRKRKAIRSQHRKERERQRQHELKHGPSLPKNRKWPSLEPPKADWTFRERLLEQFKAR